MSLNLEERLEDILKTEISSSLYYVYNELIVAILGIFIYVFHPNWLMIRNFYLNLHKTILGDMVDIFTYIVFIDNIYQHNNISPYHHITISPYQPILTA